MFHPVIFTCARHFPYLHAALLGLCRFSEWLGQCHVYCDQRDPLSAVQLQALQRLPLQVQYAIGDRSTGWGGRSVLNQLRYFHRIAANVSPDDFLLKLDADALVVGDEILARVALSNWDYVGNACVNRYNAGRPFVYGQGGGYFLRASLARRFLTHTLRDVLWQAGRRAAIPYPGCPEDAGIFEFVTRLSDRIALREYFLPTYQIQDPRATWPKWACLIHFERIWFGNLRERMSEFVNNVAE